MAKQWKCARCSTENPETTLTCSTCRMIRGAVVVPGTFQSPPSPPADYGQSWSTNEPPATGPVATEWALHASEPPRLLARIPLVIVMGVLLLIAVGVYVYFDEGRSRIAEILTAGTTVANDLEVGDCFDLTELPNGDVEDVTTRPCTDDHQYELFWSGTMPDGPYPSDSAFDLFFGDHCYGAFADYVGVGYDDTRLDIYWIIPNKDAWAEGDRYVQCSVYDPTNPRMTNSLKGSGGPSLQPLDL